jgi:hypothetical protein
MPAVDVARQVRYNYIRAYIGFGTVFRSRFRIFPGDSSDKGCRQHADPELDYIAIVPTNGVQWAMCCNGWSHSAAVSERYAFMK